jgi:spore maturation protein CgeB
VGRREGLFDARRDFLVARRRREMRAICATCCTTGSGAHAARAGPGTILARHTCAHRVDELLAIHAELEGEPTPPEHSCMKKKMNIAFFASSLVSAYWNGAATYYRGIVRALHERGHRVRFYEPDAFGRQQHRDMDDPEWAEVVVYPARAMPTRCRMVEQARGADLVVKASGVGVFDALLEEAVLDLQGPGTRVVFWDVDAPATLDRLQADAADPFHALVPRYDMVLTYGGGDPVVQAYRRAGARDCVPVYNALDPSTHHPVGPDAALRGGPGIPRQPAARPRSARGGVLPRAASLLPERRFLLGGSGWDDKLCPPMCATWATSTPPTTTRSTARRWPC